MRVLEPGLVQPGDRWEVQQRPNPDGSIEAINRYIYLAFDREFATGAATMAGLADWWMNQFLDKLEQRDAHWTEAMGD